MYRRFVTFCDLKSTLHHNRSSG